MLQISSECLFLDDASLPCREYSVSLGQIVLVRPLLGGGGGGYVMVTEIG